MKITVTATVGKEYAPFLRRKLNSLPVTRAAGPCTKKDEPRARPPVLQGATVVLVNDQKMSELHQQFMNLPGPTDVLTFPIDTDADGRITSGEVYVCVPYARREARARGIDAKFEVLLYALHGLLHLLGYDDRTARDFREMHRMEDEILAALGVGPVFARAAIGGAR